MNRIDAIFFDLDGTLTDPKLGITQSIQYALEQLGVAVPATDELTWCIGPPLLESFREMLGDTDSAERIITHFDLLPYFERVFGPDLDGALANKTDLLKYALDEVKVSPDRTMMIGDRSHDMIGARRNGVGATGVLYSHILCLILLPESR